MASYPYIPPSLGLSLLLGSPPAALTNPSKRTHKPIKALFFFFLPFCKRCKKFRKVGEM